MCFFHRLHSNIYHVAPKWLDIIIKDRLRGADRATQPKDINDIRNGFLVQSSFHGLFDARKLVVMKVSQTYSS